MASIVILAFPSFSQIREAGTIHGNIMNVEGEALPGVTVTISGLKLIGGDKYYTTDRNGYYRFSSLPPGPYTISAEISGFQKMIRQNIELHANISLTVDFKLTQTVVSEEIIVKANPPTIDIKSSSAAPVVMTDELLLATPAASKVFGGIINMAPGIDEHGAYGSGMGSPNAYQMDGINVKHPGWGGGVLIEPDYNIIKEASVQRFGLPAEYGEFTGVVFNAITKSGSNKFTGLTELRYNGKSWCSQNITNIPTEKLFDPSMKDTKQNTPEYFDVGFQIGGPIRKDKLWFFVSSEYYKMKEYPAGTTVRPKYSSPKLFSKISLQIDPSNRVNIGFNFDNELGSNVLAGPEYSPEVSINNDSPGFIVNMNWTSIFSSKTFLDAKIGYNYKDQNQTCSGGRDISGHLDLATGIYTQNYMATIDTPNRTLDLSAHISHYVPEFIKGSHELKMGIEFQRNRSGQEGGFNGPDHSFYLDLDGEPYLVRQYDKLYGLNHYFNYIIGFVQDSWSITKRLTVNLGARLNNYRYMIPSQEPSAIFKNTALSPRFGLSYDLFGNRRTVLKLHYGQYYESLYRTYFYNADTGRPTTIYKRWNGSQYVEYNRVPSSAYSVDPNIKMPYNHEVMVALEHELMKDVSFSLTGFYRKLARAIGTVNMTGQYEKVTVVNPGPDGITGTGDDSTIDVYNQTNPGQNTYIITNPKKGQSPAMIEDAYHHASGFEVVFNKKYSKRWQMQVSYTYCVAKGSVERPPLSDIGMDPNNAINQSGTNARYSGQPHFFKVLGNVLLPLDLNLGIYAHYISAPSYRPYFYEFLNQGNVTVYAEPWGVYKLDAQRTINISLAKNFKLSDFNMSVFAEASNLLNGHEVRWDYDVYAAYGPYFGKIMGVPAPRTFRIGFRFIL